MAKSSTQARRKPRRNEAKLAFDALYIEGGLLAPEWLAKVARLDAGGQLEADYCVLKGLNLRDEIGRYWRVAQALWADFAAGRSSGADPKVLTERFVVPMLRDAFGWGSLTTAAPAVIAERTYPIGYAALGGRVPAVLAPAGSGLDTLAPAFGDGMRRRSAFGLAQEYLNTADSALWGLASDGVTLRIVRDNASLTRPAWIEANLGRIFIEERYADFAAFWLLAHETRFGKPDQPVAECALEAWRNAGREEGTRAREHLRRGVEEALVALGNGFLSHPENAALRASLQDGSLKEREFFNQLLRLVYRLIFLLTVEERGLLHPDGTPDAARALYTEGYSLRRLRERSAKRSAHDQHWDVWEAVKVVFRGVGDGEPRLGLPALAGIFAKSQCPALDTAKLQNRALLLGVFKLSWLREASGLSRVNWRDMGPEELGSVYESLLELVPVISVATRSFSFAKGDETKGNARKTSGSYYTPESLVQVLLDSALEPVIKETIAANPEKPVEALLNLSIVDPACGSGHFLLAAARRLAAHVARLQTNGTPSAAEYRRAVRQVVGRCIYGVDLNAMAVELCKVALWMEAVEPGRPLSFLDSHIQHGNALLGATPELLATGVPNDAWEPTEGDDKKTASALKKQNKKERQELSLDFCASPASAYIRLGQAARAVDDANDESLAAVASKRRQWEELAASAAYDHARFVADMWCAAFVWRKVPGHLRDVAPTEAIFLAVQKDGSQASMALRMGVARLREEYRFFHWHLGFPQVFARGGFNVVLGNPPWIAHAGRAAQPILPGVKAYYQYSYLSFANYPTTHGMFVCLAARVLCQGGYLGLIIPSSVSELDSYEPTRTAHDKLCAFPKELIDFGEGQFPGVTQPCMALVSHRIAEGRTDAAPGEPWPVQRLDLDVTARGLLAKLGKLPFLPQELFGDRRMQLDRTVDEHFLETPKPVGRFNTPIRDGKDVREFQLLPPRIYADSLALGSRMRPPEDFQAVRVVVRNTARYPIATLSDGCAFRNSLLAVFETHAWPAAALVALLNSALIRWLHYMRFRDARQPVMPQVKISHLRQIPAPIPLRADALQHLIRIGERLSQSNAGASVEDRQELDSLVADIYEIDAEERQIVSLWHDEFSPRRMIIEEEASQFQPAATHGPSRGRPRGSRPA
jgi:hypothetical protein